MIYNNLGEYFISSFILIKNDKFYYIIKKIYRYINKEIKIKIMDDKFISLLEYQTNNIFGEENINEGLGTWIGGFFKWLFSSSAKLYQHGITNKYLKELSDEFDNKLKHALEKEIKTIKRLSPTIKNEGTKLLKFLPETTLDFNILSNSYKNLMNKADQYSKIFKKRFDLYLSRKKILSEDQIKKLNIEADTIFFEMKENFRELLDDSNIINYNNLTKYKNKNSKGKNKIDLTIMSDDELNDIWDSDISKIYTELYNIYDKIFKKHYDDLTNEYNTGIIGELSNFQNLKLSNLHIAKNIKILLITPEEYKDKLDKLNIEYSRLNDNNMNLIDKIYQILDEINDANNKLLDILIPLQVSALIYNEYYIPNAYEKKYKIYKNITDIITFDTSGCKDINNLNDIEKILQTKHYYNSDNSIFIDFFDEIFIDLYKNDSLSFESFKENFLEVLGTRIEIPNTSDYKNKFVILMKKPDVTCFIKNDLKKLQ